MDQRIAVVFPGQGSQRPGMGQDFYEQVPEARRVYEEASDALGMDVAGLCFGEDEKLNLTEYAQPCILTTEIANALSFLSVCSINSFSFIYYLFSLLSSFISDSLKNSIIFASSWFSSSGYTGVRP